jgi:acetylornithine deacetylase/succinyl-diaminopimelate desuccinylase-like protein
VRIRDSSESLEKHLREALTEARWAFKSPLTCGIELYVPERFSAGAIEVKFASDCSIYVKGYEHVMLFGPGSIKDAHTDHESLSRAELRDAAGHICELVCSLQK